MCLEKEWVCLSQNHKSLAFYLFLLFKQEAVDLKNDFWANSQELLASVKCGNQVQGRKFGMTIFYANGGAAKKYLARSFMFKGVAASICPEGTSETAFSETSRHFDKTRTDVNSEALCQGSICKSGEKRRQTAAIDIQKVYRKLKRDRLASGDGV